MLIFQPVPVHPELELQFPLLPRLALLLESTLGLPHSPAQLEQALELARLRSIAPFQPVQGPRLGLARLGPALRLVLLAPISQPGSGHSEPALQSLPQPRLVSQPESARAPQSALELLGPGLRLVQPAPICLPGLESRFRLALEFPPGL